MVLIEHKTTMLFVKPLSSATRKNRSSLLGRIGPAVAAVLIGAAGITALLPGSVLAKPDPLQTYCLGVANSKSDKACRQEDNLRHARNVASHFCDPKNDITGKTNCVEKLAESYIKVTAKQKPQSAKEFTKTLNRILKNTGADMNHPAEGFGAVVAAAGAIPPANAAGSTRKNCKPSDGLCAKCSSDSPEAECVQCTGNNCADAALTCTKDDCDLIKKYLNPAINTFTVAFGLVAVASLIYGAITFSSSEGDPQKTAKAKDRIGKTIFAVITYMFLYSFLQFLIPGGAFHR